MPSKNHLVLPSLVALILWSIPAAGQEQPTAPAGPWLTTDDPRPRDRREWVEVGYGIRYGVGTLMIAVSPRSPRIVYLGTDVGFIFRSMDGGVTWDEIRLLPDDIPLLDVPVMNAWAIPFPNDGLQDLYVAQAPRGSYRQWGFNFSFSGVSAMSGRFNYPHSSTGWIMPREDTRTDSYALGGSSARVEVEDPGNLMALYFRGVAAQPGRVNWIDICATDPTVAFVGTNFGGYRTRDMGITWDRIFIGSSPGENRVNSVHCHPETSQVVFLATAEGLRTSRDGGDSWQRATGNFGVWPVNYVTTHPIDRRRVVVGTELGAYETVTGEEYDELYFRDTPHPDVRRVTIVTPTTDENIIYVGTYDGASYSHDGAQTWHRMTEFLTGHYRIRSVMVDPRDPMHVYVVTDWHIFESRDGGESLLEILPGYTGLQYAVLDPRDPDEVWLVGYSQVWRYQEPRTWQGGPVSETAERARQALRRDPGHYAVSDAAMERARLDQRSVIRYRRDIRRSALVPTLDILGWAATGYGSLDLTGFGWPSMLSGYYTRGCRHRYVNPNTCMWANPRFQMNAQDRWQNPHYGVFAVLSWPFGRSIMDERATGRMWRDVFTMRNRVMYTIYDYRADRHRLLEYLASGRSTPEEEVAYVMRLEETSAVLDGMSNGMLGGPFGELSSWELE